MEWWSVGVLEYWSIGMMSEHSASKSLREKAHSEDGNPSSWRPLSTPNCIFHYSNTPTLQYPGTLKSAYSRGQAKVESSGLD